jgi:hypothetical protein
MAKKKNQSKKHKFKYSEPTAGVTSESTAARPSVTATKPRTNTVGAVATTRDFSYVFGDLTRIGLLVGSLVALELVLWVLFKRTGLGDTVYHLVQV